MQVNVGDARKHLAMLIKRAAAGKEVVIARYGKPVALLVSPPEQPKRKGKS